MLVVGLLMKHVFQTHCGASFCKGFQAARQSGLQQLGRDFSGGHTGTEGWMGVSERGMVAHHVCFGY